MIRIWSRILLRVLFIVSGFVVKSENVRKNLEVSGEYSRITVSELKDRYPNNGNGCNPYSCQEVFILVLNLITRQLGKYHVVMILIGNSLVYCRK